jgi:hypothetical protein
MMRFEFNYAVSVEFPKWIELIHDYVWQEEDDDDA